MSRKTNVTQEIKVNNFGTYNLYMRIMLNVAENFCTYENLPELIDESFLKKQLVRKGAIAFFYDDELDSVLALPYQPIGVLDVYNRPIKIQVYGQNGYQKMLGKDEFVIMYDNEGRYPIFIDVVQYAVRMAAMRRIHDINIRQQRTPRIFKTTREQELTIKNIMNMVDTNEELILTFDELDLDNLDIVVAPAPFIASQLTVEMADLWNEFYKVVGIENLETEKKERLIASEVETSTKSTQAFINNRLQPRLKAVGQIKDKFGVDIKINYLNEGVWDNGLLYNDIKNDNREFEQTDTI
ncbi:MAG: hypothetical protein NC548_33565 [Lachnospiraceae bacterium]|nr:hypothetical protein [Lachnospiraceae bacterium]MCM1232733.1 hypothetical protein [Ruminococcus flavefaciens]